MRVPTPITILGGVGALLIPVTTHEESRLCNIAPLPTAGITPMPLIQHTNHTTSPPMITIAVEFEMTTSAQKTPAPAGQKFVRQRTHGILPQVESGPSAMYLLPTLQSTPGLLMEDDLLLIYNVKGDRTGGRKGRVGIGTTGEARVGGRTTHGSRDKAATLVANRLNGSVGNSKMTGLNAAQKTGHGSRLRRGNHRRKVVGEIRDSAIRTIGATKIETETAEVVERVGSVINRDGISDLTTVT
jgi:hypothetical protein